MLRAKTAFRSAALILLLSPAVFGGSTYRKVHVTGYAKLQGGDFVEVRYPGTVLTMPTAYANYQLDVPYGVIVTAKIRDNAGKQVSRVVSAAAWDKSQGGDAKNDQMKMPDLSR